MTNVLRSASSVRLFGQLVADLAIVPFTNEAEQPKVRLASVANVGDLDNPGANLDGKAMSAGDKIILKDQDVKAENGVYVFAAGDEPLVAVTAVPVGPIFVEDGNTNIDKYFRFRGKKFKEVNKNDVNNPLQRMSANNFLDAQIAHEDAAFAKIYGCAYDGHYFDLERPTVFLVHGEGTEIGDADKRARSPVTARDSGFGASEFQFSSDMRAWDYDKADFTIRMDLHGGMFEEVLLDFELGDDMDFPSFGGGKVGGGKVGGGKVGGGKVGGGKVGGGKVGGG